MRRYILALLAACIPVACGENPSLSDSSGAATKPQLLIVSGDAQSALAGAQLPAPVVVKAFDSKGHILRGQIVNFRVTGGGGSVFAGAAVTNPDGIARERWTLGTTPGPQTLEVRAVDTETGEALTFATFTATALASAKLSVASDVSFGLVFVGATSAAQTLTATNTGGLASGPVSVSLNGLNPGAFAITHNLCNGVVLTPGASCAVDLTYTPPTATGHSAALSFTGNPGGTASANLSGSGSSLPVGGTGSGCTYTIEGQQNITRNVSENASTGAVNVITSPSNCAWSPSSNVAWLVINDPGLRIGNAAFDYSIAAQDIHATCPRTATITLPPAPSATTFVKVIQAAPHGPC
jgi:hypothetical protein